jgi:hypothetical protein
MSLEKLQKLKHTYPKLHRSHSTGSSEGQIIIFSPRGWPVRLKGKNGLCVHMRLVKSLVLPDPGFKKNIFIRQLKIGQKWATIFPEIPAKHLLAIHSNKFRLWPAGRGPGPLAERGWKFLFGSRKPQKCA